MREGPLKKDVSSWQAPPMQEYKREPEEKRRAALLKKAGSGVPRKTKKEVAD